MLKNFNIICFSHFFCFYVVKGTLNITGTDSWLSNSQMIIDNAFMLMYLVVFRPRGIRLFESFYIRRSLLERVLIVLKKAPDYYFYAKITHEMIESNEFGVLMAAKVGGSQRLINAQSILDDDIDGPIILINPSAVYELEDNDDIIPHIAIASSFY